MHFKMHGGTKRLILFCKEFKVSKPSICKLLSLQFGGTWTYKNPYWTRVEDKAYACRTCSCNNDGDCNCSGLIYLYGSGKPKLLEGGFK